MVPGQKESGERNVNETEKDQVPRMSRSRRRHSAIPSRTMLLSTSEVATSPVNRYRPFVPL